MTTNANAPEGPKTSLLYRSELATLHDVTNELSRIESFDELCESTVRLGCSQLGFDRLSLWFVEQMPSATGAGSAVGSFGVDEQGNMRDERSHRISVTMESLMGKIFCAQTPTLLRHDVPLRDTFHYHLGTGTQAVAALWDGQRVIGCLSADNFLHKRAFTRDLCKLLQFYAASVGHLCALKRAQESLQRAHHELEARVAERTAELQRTNELMRDNRNFLDNLLRHLPVAVFVKDVRHDFRYIYWNEKSAKMFGMMPEEVIDKSDYELYSKEQADLFRAKDQEAMQAGSVTDISEEMFESKLHSRIWLHTMKVPFYTEDGKLNYLLGISENITARKQAEEELVRARDELELRVQHRTLQLTELNKAMESFSYSVSHDLRAPLRSIDGFSTALREDCAEKLDEQGKSYLQRIHTATKRMENLIDALLNLSRLSIAEMRHIRVDLTALAGDLAAELQQMEPQRQADFEIMPHIIANGDPHLLRILLQNLLGNAWKFTSKKPRAKITFGTTQTAEGVVYFIRDNGAGFDMAYANKLFGAFQRLHSDNEFSGTGIGLSTVQRIVHRHGGRIWAEGKEGEGAAFYFTLGNEGGTP